MRFKRLPKVDLEKRNQRINMKLYFEGEEDAGHLPIGYWSKDFIIPIGTYPGK
jgi:hypothetical protein